MNCENCGAPMLLVPDRDYLHCEYCDTFHFLAESPDGVASTDEPAGAPCPACGEPLVHALVDGYMAKHCPKCLGTLLPQVSFQAVVQARRARSLAPPHPARPLNVEELKRRIGCPLCGRPMETHPYYGPGNIVVDNCRHCHVIWLDFGELGKTVNAPGRDRGRPIPIEGTYGQEPERKPKGFDFLLDLLWPDG